MSKILLFASILFLNLSYAQDHTYNTKNENVTVLDLTESLYSKDTTANAFYIYEKGYTYFHNEGNKTITDYVSKIKIVNSEGYNHANIEIRLNKGERYYEKLDDLVATTYFYKNGVKQWIKLDPKNIFTEENEHYDLVKFTFPNVTPGSVLVYSYKKTSPFIFKFEPWWFQDEIPKIYSEYQAKIPLNYNYNIRKIGLQELDTNTNELVKKCFKVRGVDPGDCILSKYAMNHIPAFIEEDYLTSKYNYLSRIDYELIEVTRIDGYVHKYTKTWEDVDKIFIKDGDIGKELKKTSLVKNVLPEEIQAMPNDLDKAKEIYYFVKDNYKWNGSYRFTDTDVRDILKEKSGNVAEVNILLHNIYKDQGFEVLPILASTRRNGFITKLYPVISDFNYLMVQLSIQGKIYRADATDKYVAFGMLPFRSLNNYGRLLDLKNGSNWVDINADGYSSVTYRDSLTIGQDGKTQGKSYTKYTGYHALSAQKDLDSNKGTTSNTTDEDPYLPIDANTGIVSSDVSIENEGKIVNIDYSLENSLQRINDAIYLNPFSFKFFKKNPFKLENRTYPIDFGYKNAFLYNVNIKIPENFEVTELPAQQNYRLPENAGLLQFLTQQKEDNSVNVICRVSFTKTEYEKEFYPYLKKFIDNIIDIQYNSVIVLKEII
jgi:hypothetical protein